MYIVVTGHMIICIIAKRHLYVLFPLKNRM